MKCYETRACSEKEREDCYVWSCFRENPDEMGDVRCWVMKGAYEQGSRRQLARCRKCKYYSMMNQESGIAWDYDAELAVVRCDGVINNDRTEAMDKVWENLKNNGKYLVLLDVAGVSNIYSYGLGVMMKMHKEAAAAGGMLVVVGAQGYVLTLFESTKLSRVLNLADDQRGAKDLFDAARREAEAAAAEGAAGAEEAETPKERPPCHVYWDNHNPRNVTACDECFRKLTPSDVPCWIVDGMIEGVSFQYVNEDCDDCRYFQEFGAKS